METASGINHINKGRRWFIFVVALCGTVTLYLGFSATGSSTKTSSIPHLRNAANKFLQYIQAGDITNRQMSLFKMDGTGDNKNLKEEKFRCTSVLQAIIPTSYADNTQLLHASGCKLQNITRIQAIGCVRPATHFVFMGDSRIRQLYCDFTEFLEGKMSTCRKFQDNRVAKINGLVIEFLWRPKLKPGLIDVIKRWLDNDTRPHIIVMGMGVWRMHQSETMVQGLETYRELLSRIAPYLATLNEVSKVIWSPQDPVDEKILDHRRRMLSNKLVDRYNNIAREILEPKGITIWWSAFITASHFRAFSKDCVHIYRIVDTYKTQVFWNWICHNARNTSTNGNCCGL